jgi:hypothetical protein
MRRPVGPIELVSLNAQLPLAHGVNITTEKNFSIHQERWLSSHK